jgi:chromosome segregation ATPase
VRDRILVTYRAEIESHKMNDRDFCSLRAHIEDLRRRKEALDISAGTLQGDFEAQLSSQEHVIQSMKNELSMFKTKCNDMQRESVEISEMTQQVRIEVSASEVELGELSQGIQTSVAHNQSLERECETLKLSINEG